ncbi:MAG TPA: M20 family metallopeptidase [Bryobacteraceae bacterium]|nr:M20 family metallopeptidase [Bryobacteraceae bacterium]
MDSHLSFAQSRQSEIVGFIRRLVECESPSDDPAAVNCFVELFAGAVSDIAETRTFPGGRFGNHLRCEFELPGRRKSGQILAIGHSDTVYTTGTLARMPFREADGRIWGPGALDMKGGLAFFVFAIRALRALETPVSHRVVLLVNSDEEVGSDSSRALIEREARKSEAVLVLEPATGLEGKLKTARKGVGDYTMIVRGRSAHAGLDFSSGANAIVELAQQIGKVSRFTKLERGVTVSPGVISGGTRSNVVPDEARVTFDIRAPRASDAAALDRKFRALKPVDKRCIIEVAGGVNRPPMERSASVVRLFRTARRLAGELGRELEESTSGGGSDGNFTAALGVPTLDGLGAVGEGAHSPRENILADRIADRTALLAKLVAAL